MSPGQSVFLMDAARDSEDKSSGRRLGLVRTVTAVLDLNVVVLQGIIILSDPDALATDKSGKLGSDLLLVRSSVYKHGKQFQVNDILKKIARKQDGKNASLTLQSEAFAAPFRWPRSHVEPKSAGEDE